MLPPLSIFATGRVAAAVIGLLPEARRLIYYDVEEMGFSSLSFDNTGFSDV